MYLSLWLLTYGRFFQRVYQSQKKNNQIRFIYVRDSCWQRDHHKRRQHCTEVRFASFLSGEFITAIVVNQPERKLVKRTSVHYSKMDLNLFSYPTMLTCLTYLNKLISGFKVIFLSDKSAESFYKLFLHKKLESVERH